MGENYNAVRKALCTFFDFQTNHSPDPVLELVSKSVSYFDSACEAVDTTNEMSVADYEHATEFFEKSMRVIKNSNYPWKSHVYLLMDISYHFETSRPYSESEDCNPFAGIYLRYTETIDDVYNYFGLCDYQYLTEAETSTKLKIE
jgi:hypothetical protein